MQFNLGDLVYQAQNGDRTACSKLYQLTFKSSYYLASRFVGSADDAADIVSRSYKKAFTNISTLKNPERFEAWIQHITAMNCVDFMIEENRIDFQNYEVSDSSGKIDSSTEFLPKGIENAEKAGKAINRIIDSLNDNQKTVVFLHYYNEMPVTHIAKALSCSEDAVIGELDSARYNIKTGIDRLINRETQTCPLTGIPAMVPVLQKAKQEEPVNEDLLRSIFRTATEGMFKISVEDKPVIPGNSEISERPLEKALPDKKTDKKKISQKQMLIAALIVLLVVALAAVSILVIPMFSSNGNDSGQEELAVDSQMLTSIEPYEEAYENILTAFSDAIADDEDILGGGFNFVYFNDNDIPDLALNYKRSYSNSPDAYDEILICMDGASDETFGTEPTNTWVGQKGYYIVSDNSVEGEEKSEAYYKYKYTDEKNDKEFSGGLRYDKFLNDEQSYQETWIYMEDADGAMQELSGWEEYNQKKEALFAGFYQILSGYDIEDFVDSGKNLVKYLKRAKPEYFSSLESSEETTAAQSDASTQTTQSDADSATYIKASSSDWKALEDDLETIMTFCSDYNYKSTDSYEVVLPVNMTEGIYSHYFDTDAEYAYGNDPLGYFDETEYYTFKAEDIDWIISNIFNQTPNHNLNTSKRYYYNGNYYSVFYPSSAPIVEAKVSDNSKQADGSYIITVKATCYTGEGFDGEDVGETYNCKVHAALRNIGGKKHWSFFSIETLGLDSSSQENTTSAKIPEWEATYTRILSSESDYFYEDCQFILKDIDNSGTPDLVVLDRRAQTDWIYIFMNGKDNEDDMILFISTDLYINSSGELGTYDIYSSGGEYFESYARISLNKTNATFKESAGHFKGFADSLNKTGEKEEWSFSDGADDNVMISQSEYDAFVQNFKSEYTKIEEYSVYDYKESGKALSTYLQ